MKIESIDIYKIDMISNKGRIEITPDKGMGTLVIFLDPKELIKLDKNILYKKCKLILEIEE